MAQNEAKIPGKNFINTYTSLKLSDFDAYCYIISYFGLTNILENFNNIKKGFIEIEIDKDNFFQTFTGDDIKKFNVNIRSIHFMDKFKYSIYHLFKDREIYIIMVDSKNETIKYSIDFSKINDTDYIENIVKTSKSSNDKQKIKFCFNINKKLTNLNQELKDKNKNFEINIKNICNSLIKARNKSSNEANINIDYNKMNIIKNDREMIRSDSRKYLTPDENISVKLDNQKEFGFEKEIIIFVNNEFVYNHIYHESVSNIIFYNDSSIIFNFKFNYKHRKFEKFDDKWLPISILNIMLMVISYYYYCNSTENVKLILDFNDIDKEINLESNILNSIYEENKNFINSDIKGWVDFKNRIIRIYKTLNHRSKNFDNTVSLQDNPVYYALLLTTKELYKMLDLNTIYNKPIAFSSYLKLIYESYIICFVVRLNKEHNLNMNFISNNEFYVPTTNQIFKWIEEKMSDDNKNSYNLTRAVAGEMLSLYQNIYLNDEENLEVALKKMNSFSNTINQSLYSGKLPDFLIEDKHNFVDSFQKLNIFLDKYEKIIRYIL